MLLAVTPYEPLNHTHQGHLCEIEPLIDGVLLRTPMTQHDIKRWIEEITARGFPKEKLIIHSDIDLALMMHIHRIHFSQYDEKVKSIKTTYPQFVVSMSVHNVEAIQYAQQYEVDFGLFGHLFPTPSKPNQSPRTAEEIDHALATTLPLVAIGGINVTTVSNVPTHFSGIACIGALFNRPYNEVQQLSEQWRKRRS
ncbi:thiamine phosphate synthase [Staphylococcus sp. 11261D007BR]